jgi:hypothetical protein
MIDFFDKQFVHEVLTDKTFGLMDGEYGFHYDNNFTIRI